MASRQEALTDLTTGRKQMGQRADHSDGPICLFAARLLST